MFFRILILSTVSALLSGADPLYMSCLTEKGNYTGNEKFKTNLDRLLDDLSSNITRNASQPGFYEASIGDFRDKVYGQALCRGDVDSTVCKNCVQSASRYIFGRCESMDAIVWYELCQVRYSTEMFSGMQVYTGKYPDHNHREKEIASNRNRFSEVLMLLMNEVSNETAFNLSRNMFATGETELSKGKIVYGLSQCTRDIIPGDCRSCLNSAITELGKCCSSREGGIILSQSCNLRFQLYRFYNITSNSHSTYSFPKGDQWKIWKVLVLIILAFLLVIVIGSYAVFHRQNNRRDIDDKGERALLQELTSHTAVTITEDGNLVTSEELPFVDLVTIKAATNDFADSNKLGQGGFGSVYKGVFPNGKELAVKRLSRKSWQGLEEFKNEVILIAKLQHRNLVRLVGCGFEGEEKLLLYEFMPNRSLDFFIFDSDRRSQLDWETYHNIISGIARGLLYLHEESRLKIIHRDLKPSNVLLDLEMVAKISDFGMARIFCDSQKVANTKRVVGTYGYMAPEYAMGGQFSIKSDVFSFGVILLEIISGQKNSGFYQITKHAPTLLAYAWRLWKEGKELEFVDPLLRGSSPTQDVLKCMHVGLLCVQEDPADRPNMSAVVVSLQGRESTPLPDPRQPALSVRRVPIDQPMEDHSVNELTISTISPR